MEEFDRKQHWENIYRTRQPEEASWYQPLPSTSLELIKYFKVPKAAKIIDVGGDGFRVDHLLDMGYQDVIVLDISVAALQRASRRLGISAARVKWNG